jgi:hypothetical protein
MMKFLVSFNVLQLSSLGSCSTTKNANGTFKFLARNDGRDRRLADPVPRSVVLLDRCKKNFFCQLGTMI